MAGRSSILSIASTASFASADADDKPGSRERMQSAIVKVGVANEVVSRLHSRVAAKKTAVEKEEEKKKEAAKKKAAGIDPVFFGSVGVCSVGLLWMIASTVLSGMFTIRYLGIIEEDQSWYLLNGAAEFAREEATRVLRAAAEARDALAASITFGHISTSFDYASIERSLASPMVFNPFLKSVEIAFSDREAGLRITHVRAGDAGQLSLVLQSNAADCFLLGPQGCADLGVEPEEFPAYFDEASFLKMEEQTGGTNESSQGISRSKLLALSREAAAAEAWESASLSLGDLEGSGLNDAAALVWIPTLTLIFRQPLPEDWSEERHAVVGRVTLEVGELTGNRLRDERLGDTGRSFLVDRKGTVLASLTVQDTLQVNDGRIGFRTLKDLPDAPWASSLDPAFKDEGAMSPMQVQGEDGYAAAFLPLRPPLGDFAVVVACAIEGTTFKDDVTFTYMLVLSGFASLPYAIAVVLTFFACGKGGDEFESTKEKEPTAAKMFAKMSVVASGLTRVTTTAVRRSSLMAGISGRVSGKRGSVGPEILEVENDYGTSRDGFGTRRHTHMEQDIAFERDRSFKGSVARSLRRWLGKGRQEG